MKNSELQVADKKEEYKKTKEMNSFWNDHRITLIAYQTIYVHEKRPDQFLEEKNQKQQKNGKNKKDGKQKKEGGRKKQTNLQYESSFLSLFPEESIFFSVEELVKQYEYLSALFTDPQDKNFTQVKIFIKIMLELKHSAIVNQFCEIYNLIVEFLLTVSFEEIVKEEDRFKWLSLKKESILKYVQENQNKFKYFSKYLQEDQIQTKKLIQVQIYCMLAEKFNFNVNEYYKDSFGMLSQSPIQKKIKKSQ